MNENEKKEFLTKVQKYEIQKYRSAKKWCRPFYGVDEERERSGREADQVFGAKALTMPKIIMMMIMPRTMMMMIMPRMIMMMISCLTFVTDGVCVKQILPGVKFSRLSARK